MPCSCVCVLCAPLAAALMAFSRPPTETERDAGVEFLAQQTRDRSVRDPKLSPAESRRQALTDYCQALFGLNEFAYVD